MKDDFFKLFACCILVKGIRRSVLIDCQRQIIRTIPNSLFLLLDQCNDFSINYLKKGYEEGEKKIFDEYFNWLIQNEYGFWCTKNEKDCFPKINMKYDDPNRITNMIIDIDRNSLYNVKKVINQIKLMGIPHLQIRSYKKMKWEKFRQIINLFEDSRTTTIDIITPYFGEIISIKDLYIKNRRLLRLNSLLYYNHIENKTMISDDGISRIIFSKKDIQDKASCGLISNSFFSINIETVTESQHHNTCLNRKISIDANGEIKNCPSMQKSYGNIKDTTLEEALNKQGFKDLWNIKKDDIKICQDCEFRHICTDCRVFIDNPSDIYSHPAKCKYNPYLAKWEGEEGYVPAIEMIKEGLEK